MTPETTQMRWTNAEWLDEVGDWVTFQAARLDYKITGPITQPHVRPWATALRVPTIRGTLWFKASGPALPHESAITEALSRWSHGRTPQVLAFDLERNWLLMADGGATLKSAYQAAPDPVPVYRAAEVYAGLQKALVTRVDELLALGAPDCRLATLPLLYAGLLDNDTVLRVGEEDCLTADDLARLRSLVPLVEALARELSAFGIPETLQHDDLHTNNIMVHGSDTVIFDWGDCSLSHPLFSLVVMLRSVARDFDAPEDSPEVLFLRNAFLAAWALPLTQLQIDRACALADALGRINRALTWQRVLRGMEEPHFGAYVSAVSGWLQEFLEAVDDGDFQTQTNRG